MHPTNRWTWSGTSPSPSIVERLLLITLTALTIIGGNNMAQAQFCPAALGKVCSCAVLPRLGLDIGCKFVTFGEVQKALETIQAEFMIHVLKIDGPDILELPEDAFKSAKIRQLTLANSALGKLHSAALTHQKPTLTHLHLVNNSLTRVPDLTGFEELVSLDLSGNDIQQVPVRAFKDSTNLQHLRLGRNRICTMLPLALNETKSQLTLLDLSDNCLSLIPARNIRGYQRLSWLDFSQNRIGDIPNLQFVNMAELQDLWLDSNRIGNIATMSFMNVPRLRRLSLRANRMSILEPNRFHPFEALEVLDLSENKLGKLMSSSFRDMPQLSQLLLNDNAIKQMVTAAFSNLPRLKLINLKNNQLAILERNAFDQLPQMAMLLLQNNSLAELDPGLLSGMPNLRQLNLRQNLLHRIAPGTFDLTPQLTTLDLASNNLTILMPHLFDRLQKLFWLDLSDNRIQRFPVGTFQGKIANLLINDNPIECDGEMDWLVDYLVKNQIRTFLPTQSEVLCAGPPGMKGTPLKDLMIQKANETLQNNINTFKSFGSLIPPGLTSNPGSQSIPLASLLGPSIGRMLPGLDALPPGFASIPLPGTNGGAAGLNGFTQPLAGLISSHNANGGGLGGDPGKMNAQVRQLISGLPGLVQSLPTPGAAGALPPLQNVSPQLIDYVMKGGKIPGVSDAMIQQYIRQQMAAQQPQLPIGGQKFGTAGVGLGAQGAGQLIPNGAVAGGTTGNYGAINSGSAGAQQPALPPLSSLDPAMLQRVLSGQPIPGVSPAQLTAIKAYYLKQIQSNAQSPQQYQPQSPPVALGGSSSNGLQNQNINGPQNQQRGPAVSLITGDPPALPSSFLDPSVINDLQLPLAGLDLSKLSPEVLKDVAAGKLPNLSEHPEFLQIIQDNPGILTLLESRRRPPNRQPADGSTNPASGTLDANGVDLSIKDSAGTAGGGSVDEDEGRDGGFQSAANYDLDHLNLDHSRPSEVPQTDALWITGVVIGITAILTIVTLGFVCFQRYQRRRISSALEKDRLFFSNPSPRPSLEDFSPDSSVDVGPNINSMTAMSAVSPFGDRQPSWVYTSNADLHTYQQAAM